MNLGNLPYVPLGATGILGLTVLMIFRGALIPRKTYEERLKDKDDQISFYRNALESETTRNAELMGQVNTLMEVATTAEHVFRSLPEAAGRTEGEVNELAAS